ncbi:MAG: DsbA family protein [Candidatus Micrarchaeota archaeon]|nr:DsbA family protein [Candidatus Micrarchaeota archaeon]
MRLPAGLALAMLLLFGCTGFLQNEPLPEGMTADGKAYRGAAAPKLVIYEYSDFQCPFCARVQGTVEEVLRAYPGEVQLQFRHYPLENLHPEAFGAAVAAVCAERQGAFWKMHDKMYSNQQALYKENLTSYAHEIGLDMKKFEECLGSEEAALEVKKEMEEGAKKGVRATPTFLIGESKLEGALPFSTFKSMIDSELAKKRG